MAKSIKKARERSGRVSNVKSEAKKPAKEGSRKGYKLRAEAAEYLVKGGSGRMIVGRNASTGQFVLAPAVKASNAFKSRKTSVVREVIKERRAK